MNRTKTQPRRVNFHDDNKDREVLRLAALGRTTRHIAFVTGLTPSQITYRLSKTPISRTGIRSGLPSQDKYKFAYLIESAASAAIMKRIDLMLDKEHLQ